MKTVDTLVSQQRMLAERGFEHPLYFIFMFYIYISLASLRGFFLPLADKKRKSCLKRFDVHT